MSRSLEGQTAVVTGASSGLGLRFAKLLAGQGAKVALMARRTDRLSQAVADIEAAGGEAVAILLDVADPAAIGPALDAAQAKLGPLSILINNAGVGGAGMALELSVEDFDQAFDVNVRAVFLAAREAARRMLDNGTAAAGQARIVNIASMAAFEVLPGLSAYNASKSACAMLTKTLAREWARHHIAVNALCPGYIETEINADWFKTDGGLKQIQSFPRRRLMDEGSLDEAMLLLTGPSARFITGTLLMIDDGQSL
jgi:NAD(P)-dependent dehydrogenase (short-subunit alcohol dehydrogenase family)